MSGEYPTIGVTIGDPAGIGSQIGLMAALDDSLNVNVVMVGAIKAVRAANAKCDLGADITAVEDLDDPPLGRAEVGVYNIDNIDEHEFGTLRAEYGAASVEYLSTAVELGKEGQLDGVVGGPINRTAIDESDACFSGPEELFQHHTDIDHYSIMLLTDNLRVTHVTPEVGLREACDMVSEDLVLSTIQKSSQELEQMGMDQPELAVAGLNPHAGLDGLYGEKDTTEIQPAVERAQSDGIAATGPESPDSVFADAVNGSYDCVVTMYHDQGHIPIKTLGFKRDEIRVSVIPLDMPFPYAAVGHGTAFSTAARGTGASPASLMMSIENIARKVREA
jgi:4-hydroxythreonine-4-phosphate dehydrogenase